MEEYGFYITEYKGGDETQPIDSKQYEILLEKHRPTYAEHKRGLDLVLQFLMEKKRILYGGMAIDAALKSKTGVGIYPPDLLPDFDFLSPSYLQDSCEIADLLHANNFKDVNVINGIHFITRRVRIEHLLVVADVGFVDKDLYPTIPYLEYEGLRFVHPHYQKMDMLRACSFPFDDCPLCVIFHRMKKDIKRFNMLEDAYPIEYKGEKIKTKTLEYDTFLIEGQVIHGFLAYSIILRCYEDMLAGLFNVEQPTEYHADLAKFAKAYKKDNLLPYISLKYEEGSGKIKMEVPDIQPAKDKEGGYRQDLPYGKYKSGRSHKSSLSGRGNKFGGQDSVKKPEGLVIITDNFETSLEAIQSNYPLIEKEYYRPYRDLIPDTLVLHNESNDMNLTLYQFKHRLIAIKFYDGKITTIFTYVLVYFLLKYFATNDEIYLLFYGSLKNIITNANTIISEYLSTLSNFSHNMVSGEKIEQDSDKKHGVGSDKQDRLENDKSFDEASRVLIKSLPFFLSSECAGKDNISINIIKWFKEKLSGRKKKYVPNSYYPDSGKPCPEPVINEFFLQNGSLRKT